MTHYILLAGLATSLTATVPLDVHVYDLSDIAPAVMNETKGILAGVLRQAGIELRWTVEPSDSPDARRVVIADPPRASQERMAACAALRAVAVSILHDSAAGLKQGVLGYAEPLAAAGINVTVYFGRVRNAAENYGVSVAVVLAHAIAHEIGHVFLRTAAHRKGGLMSGGWDSVQFGIMRLSGMFFDREDARRMRHAIQGEGCT